mmetsp:Transcript_5753/g.11408  ORF Transcript_5753/g.11408 Transcript_5753/m.11408 type:complete len:471 (-) Transcript_5753:200-1612(-)|eukprot:CAMPEP_0167785838 /NCGR_PEP_ID=MMETSP0111_2-20121227/8446_1 /TAXON_ID=91324 /ORGANISM="Lotharella globosa, Strain CCCM811" /LENGTH=470 /DNA_ID=CAMNT_0007677127 /DNA_START=64 /DNA_END=1476 /DNA_ORIENTATION=-
MAMNVYQCKEMFPAIDLDVIQMVIDNHGGNQEKILAALLQMTPKDTRTINRVKKKLKLFQTQHWQVTTSRGLNIRTQPSMSITTPIVGALRAGEYIEEIEHRETKAGKLWVRHARGWSLATRKGEVGMRRVKNPYEHLNIDQIIEEADSMPATKLKDKKAEKKPKKKKSKKKKSEKKLPQMEKAKASASDPFDPFDDPFVKAAGGSAPAPSNNGFPSTGFPGPTSSAVRSRRQQRNPNPNPTFEDLAISKPQQETKVLSGLSPTNANMGKGGLDTFFDDSQVDNPVEAKEPDTPVNILDEVMAASGAPTPAKKQEETKIDLWGGDLVNLEDVTKEKKKKKKSHTLTLREIQGETITVAKAPGGPMGPPPMMPNHGKPPGRGSLDVFFAGGGDPFAQGMQGSGQPAFHHPAPMGYQQRPNPQQQMMMQQNMMQRNMMMQQQQNMMQNPFMQQQAPQQQTRDPFGNLAWQQH